jgi:hypothetical protein
MTDTVISQNIGLSSRDILYILSCVGSGLQR